MQASRTRNYVKGLASGYVVTLATIGVKLWLTPFVLRYLDREEFAVFLLAGDVLFMYIFDLQAVSSFRTRSPVQKTKGILKTVAKVKSYRPLL